MEDKKVKECFRGANVSKELSTKCFNEAIKVYNPKSVVPSVRLLDKSLSYYPENEESIKMLATIFKDGGMPFIQGHYCEMLGERVLLSSEVREEIKLLDIKKMYEESMNNIKEGYIDYIKSYNYALLKGSELNSYIYNILGCFFIDNQVYKLALDLLGKALKGNPKNSVFANNYFIALSKARENNYSNLDKEDIVSLLEESQPKLKDGDVLIRVMQEKKYINSLREKGEIYFNPTSKFRDLESDPRGDEYENKPHSIVILDEPNGKKIGSDFNQIGKPFGITGRGEIVVSHLSLSLGGMKNVYCFTKVSQENLEEFLSNYAGHFGGHALIITNPLEFLRRTKAALKAKEKKGIKNGDVIYASDKFVETIEGIFSPYIKRVKYQNEYEHRISYDGNGSEAEIITIGSITDISEVVEVKGLEKRIKEVF